MSRFVLRSRFVALGFLGAASLSGPALADAAPLRAADSCVQWSARTAPACRVGTTAARRTGTRIAMAEARQSLFDDVFVPVRGRYVSLLILGVGF